MTAIDRHLPQFIIGKHDRITFPTVGMLPGMPGKSMRLVYATDDGVVLRPAEGAGPSETFSYAQLRRMNAAREIHHEPEFYLPVAQRSTTLRNELDVIAPTLSDAERRRVDARYALVMAFDVLSDNDAGAARIKRTDESIAANMDLIRDTAAEYLSKTGPTPDFVERVREYRENGGRKPQGGQTAARPEAVAPRTLRKWSAAMKAGGKWALRDKCCNRGNKNGHFTTDEQGLLSNVIREFYLDLNRPSVAQTVMEVRRVFLEKNAVRREQGLTEMRIPSRDAVRSFIKGIDELTRLVERYGHREALKWMKPVTRGLEVSRPLERVEMDECKIDLITIMAQAGLLQLFTPEELVKMGLDNKKRRWWLVFAIDCRTRMILGMKLTNEPKTTAASECLRMVLEDKGEFADAVGAMTPWWHHGKPENLVTDNGVFRSIEFTDTCANVGIGLLRTVAGAPGMRGMIERLFRTAIMSLFSRLSGRVFSNVLERGDHPSEERACLTTEQLGYAIVRWVVDIYHNTLHEGLGGLTPLQQWSRDMEDGNYPLHALPTRATTRIAFGVPIMRQLSKTGITVGGIRYHDEVLAHRHLSHGDHEVEVRWDHTDIGRIAVCVENRWIEARSVHRNGLLGQALDGLSAAEWDASVRALRASDPKRQAFDESVVHAAIKDIQAMNHRQQLEYQVINQDWSKERVLAREEVMMSFEVRPDTPRTHQTADDYGRTIQPRAPMENVGSEAAALPKPDRGPKFDGKAKG
ncbi:Mu transposase C-terminal domain-containing protein [Paracoccus yeei]|uniref:Mu transposase C-terminal domain-containing protein n=1 Tax=Paracoccus yeei TaxID=147645 RepID=UPI003BF87AC4